jgi:signal transduction histidine kinase
MIEFQHDHEYMAALVDLMAATNAASDPQQIAAGAIDRLMARDTIIGGGIWLDRDGELLCVSCQNLDPGRVLPEIQSAITLAAPEPISASYGPEARLFILPLRDASGYFGALAIATRAPADAGQQLMLRAVAAHLSSALSHAWSLQNDREWETFLAHAAHEIKNPLASIKGYADLLLRRAAKDPADPYRKGLTTISNQVLRTTALLEQISDITRIGSSRMTIDRHMGDFAALVERVVQEHQSAEPLHTITLDRGGSALHGRFDAVRMGQVVGALIGNAIKFSPDGGEVNVLLRRSDADDGAPVAMLSVSDTGVGVPAGEHERVFERFFRGSNIRGTFSGLGVGLYIAREILNLHGGQVWLESQSGQGTTCHVALPLAP